MHAEEARGADGAHPTARAFGDADVVEHDLRRGRSARRRAPARCAAARPTPPRGPPLSRRGAPARWITLPVRVFGSLRVDDDRYARDLVRGEAAGAASVAHLAEQRAVAERQLFRGGRAGVVLEHNGDADLLAPNRRRHGERDGEDDGLVPTNCGFDLVRAHLLATALDELLCAPRDRQAAAAAAIEHADVARQKPSRAVVAAVAVAPIGEWQVGGAQKEEGVAIVGGVDVPLEHTRAANRDGARHAVGERRERRAVDDGERGGDRNADGARRAVRCFANSLPAGGDEIGICSLIE